MNKTIASSAGLMAREGGNINSEIYNWTWSLFHTFKKLSVEAKTKLQITDNFFIV